MASPPLLSDVEIRAWGAYRRMRALLELEITRDLARDAGLSAPDYDVLSTLSEEAEAPWRAHALAERLLWSTSRLAHHLQRMEQRGLIRREPLAADGRGALVGLTEAGWAALRAAAPAHAASVRRHFVGLLEPDQIATFEVIAQKVVAHLSSP